MSFRPVLQVLALWACLSAPAAQAFLCPLWLRHFGEGFRWVHGPNVVAVHRHEGLLFLFGRAGTADRVYWQGQKNALIYQGRIKRIPLRKVEDRRGLPLFEPAVYLPAGKVPRAVRHRVSGFYSLTRSENGGDVPLSFGTEDGTVVVAAFSGGDPLEKEDELPYRAAEVTYFLVPSALEDVAKVRVKLVGAVARRVRTVERPSLDSPYLLATLIEGSSSRAYLTPAEAYRSVQEQAEQEPPGWLDYGAWGAQQRATKPNTETWLLRAGGWQNFADANDNFSLFRYGSEAMKIADEDYSFFYRATVSDSAIWLYPQVLEPGERRAVAGDLTAPLKIDIRDF